MAKKADQAQTDQRVKEICQWKLDGYTRTDILRFAKEKWQIGPDRTDQLIAEATSKIKEINALSIQDNMAILNNQYWNLWRQAAAIGDISEQHRILNSIAKLKGLDKVTINHIVEDKRELADLSDEELDRMLLEGSADASVN